MMNGPVLNLQCFIANFYIFPLRETVRKFTTNHSFDNSVFRNFICSLIHRLDGTSITDNCDFVGYISNLIQFMCDDDRGKTVFLEFKHQIQQGL